MGDEPSQNSNSPLRKGFFKRIANQLSLDRITAAAALGAVSVSGLALWIANEQLVSGNRAWLSPGDIVVEKAFQPGKSQEIYLTFGNTGNSPALKVTRDIKLISLPKKTLPSGQP